MIKFVVLLCLAASAFAAPRAASPRLGGRIAGGSATTIEKFPYQISLYFTGVFICGGSIISENYVLTAAQCTIYSSTASRYTVRAGSTSLFSGGTVYSVARVLAHPSYDAWLGDLDFALIQISGSFSGVNQQSIALPAQGEAVADGAAAVVTGWGILNEGEFYPTILQELTVPIVTLNYCSAAYYAFYGKYFPESFICAGVSQEGLGTCMGDEGGPLVVDGKLVGVAAWGFGCARYNYPDVYSRVATVRNWIAQNSGV